jgi:hypothetical protein
MTMLASDLTNWVSLLIWVVSTAAGKEDAQHTLDVGPPAIDAAAVLAAHDVYDYGIGIDLCGSYGTISISYSNGTKVNLAKVDGSESDKALFKKLSLEASQHIHPPYQSFDEPILDAPRQELRRLNKANGLPASEDVGTISTMITKLVTMAEFKLGHNITAALLAAPNLVALYKEDVIDAFEYSQLQVLDKLWDLDNVYHETGAAVAANDFGLCQNFTDIKSCMDEEWEMPREIVLSVLYTEDCLCVELASVSSASYVSGYRMSPPTMDFTLGLKALHDNPSETYYWEAVRDTILRGMVVELYDHQPGKVFVMGDQSHNEKFRTVLNEALIQYDGKLPQIFDEDPVFRAAQGAAEMARRRRFV